ncbi:hypothetical protein [Serratia fonticola]|uniref:Eaa protein n=1 Tax=Serratia fonticola TaxID=47917 RepID=A0ABY9PIZ8_SERFO|nr:hypothetical protein [Serratia fonticola]WMT13390.1 hypothetical protein RFB13_19430 [Serratia fonticola]
MTKSTVTTERLREIIERRSPSLRWGEAEKVAAELLAVREAQSVPAGKFVLEPSDQRYHHIKHGEYQHTEPKLPMIKLYTAPPAPAAPQSDHLKRALKLAGEAKELADRIRAEELTLQTPVVPDDVAAALDWIDDFIARCNGDDRGSCNSVNILRRAILAAMPATD